MDFIDLKTQQELIRDKIDLRIKKYLRPWQIHYGA